MMVRFNRMTAMGGRPSLEDLRAGEFDGEDDLHTDTQGGHSDDSEDEQTVTYRKAQIMIESIKNDSVYMKRAISASYESDYHTKIGNVGGSFLRQS